MTAPLDGALQWIAYARREIERGDLRAASAALERAASCVRTAKAQQEPGLTD